MTDQEEVKADSADQRDYQQEDDARHENRQCSGILLPLLPLGRIDAVQIRELTIQLYDRLSESPCLVPGYFKESQA